jgi:hypothetical protein
MITMLFAWLEKISDDVEPSTIWYSAAGELILFDAPVIVILIIMWRSVMS